MFEEKNGFQMQSRESLIVYLYYNRDVKKLRQMGDIFYHSKKHRYVQLYVNTEDLERVLDNLLTEKFVKKVEQGQMKKIPYDFVGILQTEEE